MGAVQVARGSHRSQFVSTAPFSAIGALGQTISPKGPEEGSAIGASNAVKSGRMPLRRSAVCNQFKPCARDILPLQILSTSNWVSLHGRTDLSESEF
jgi:hypothetical protein